MRTRFLITGMLLTAQSFALPLMAQQEGADATLPSAAGAGIPAVDDVEALVARMRERIDAIAAAENRRNDALNHLERQVEKAASRIEGSQASAEAERQRAANLGARVEDLDAERAELASTADKSASLVSDLQGRITDLADMIAASRQDKDELERRLAAERAARTSFAVKLAELRRRSGQERNTRDRQLDERSAALGVAEEEVVRLRDQLAKLTAQLASVSDLLEQSDDTVREQQTRIDDLGGQLDEALRARVEELSAYRSEFFGKLKAALGNRPEFRVVGDRFVFQSEVLFASGSARIDPAGQAELRQLATTLREVAATIPPDLDWILRVDGHTDRIPVGTGSPFASNWELSTARAISVVQFLIRDGIDPKRLAAAGFGEFQPLDPADDEIAYRRNRRIEFKLTSG